MIDFIEGLLYSIEEDSIIVNVNGIGYQLFVPNPNEYTTLVKQSCFIYTHHHMREDWMGLFGFQKKEERYLFRLLIGVSGIGPKGGLAIIAQGNPNKIIEAIATEDQKTLIKMPGVGKKTAQRIILDLKDKVKGLTIFGETSSVIEDNNEKIFGTEKGIDLKEALKALGYHEQEISKALKTLSDSIERGEAIDKLIKQALQILMRE